MIAYLATAVVVAAVGYRLGTGDLAGAATTAVAGCPLALVLALLLARLPRPDRMPAVRAVHLLAGTDRAELLRHAAALHATDPGPTGRALVDAGGELPGVSDLDGTPATGLRGVTSDLHDGPDGPAVVAHAVLCGPAGWPAAHGLDEPADLPAGAVLVAWDGVVRGAVEIGSPARRVDLRRAALGTAAAAAVGGALAAPLLPPLGAGAWPVVTALAVALLHHPIVATNR